MRILATIFMLVLPLAVVGQEELDDDRKVLKRPNVNAAMSESVYKRLSTIHDQMGEEQLGAALEGLRRLEKSSLSNYEEALVQQTFGFVYAQQSNEAEAIKRFEKSLALDALPATAHQGMLYSLAGLYAAEGQYLRSIETAREWFRYEESPSPDAYMLIGSSFAELERLGEAFPYVMKAIEKSESPKENWYMLGLAIHLQRDRYRPAAKMLETMLRIWPDKPRYWDMLAGCYLELKDDNRAHDTMMLSYSAGMLTNPTRILGLVQLSLMRDMPYTAASILEEQIAAGIVEETEINLKMLLQAWLGASEYDRAVGVINRLGPYADDGQYFLQAAQIYYETGEWEKVEDNAAKALDAGLKKPADALLLQGTALAELGRYSDAVKVFNRVRSTGDTQHRRNAESWIAFVDEKRQLQAARIPAN